MSSSSFDVQIAHSVEEIGHEAWDAAAGNRPFASHRWYHFGETVQAGDTPVYIILRRQGDVMARATFWLKRREAVPIVSKSARALATAILRRWPLLVCRTPIADASGLLLPESSFREAALKTIIEVAREEAGRHHASFLLFDYLHQNDAAWSAWPAAFTPLVIADPGTRLTITWPDFESYLQQLSRSTRNDYRRSSHRAADLGLEIRCHATVSVPDQALALIKNVARHHNSPITPSARAILANASLVEATWLTVETGEKLVACGLLLADGNTGFLTLLGRDYSVKFAYFQLVYAAIHRAIESGVQVLWAGSGAYELKQRLGFELVRNNYVTFSTGNPQLRWLARRLATS